MDLNTLYRTVIMDNYKNPKNKGLKQTDDYHFVHLNNPSCGDEMNVEIKIEDGIIKDVRQDGHGCSISMSSASVMSDVLIGKTVEEARKIKPQIPLMGLNGIPIKHEIELEIML